MEGIEIVDRGIGPLDQESGCEAALGHGTDRGQGTAEGGGLRDHVDPDDVTVIEGLEEWDLRFDIAGADGELDFQAVRDGVGQDPQGRPIVDGTVGLGRRPKDHSAAASYGSLDPLTILLRLPSLPIVGQAAHQSLDDGVSEMPGGRCQGSSQRVVGQRWDWKG